MACIARRRSELASSEEALFGGQTLVDLSNELDRRLAPLDQVNEMPGEAVCTQHAPEAIRVDTFSWLLFVCVMRTESPCKIICWSRHGEVTIRHTTSIQLGKTKWPSGYAL